MNTSSTIYRVETQSPKWTTLFTFQGSNSKRDAIRFAEEYKKNTGVNCHVRREKHLSGSTIFRTK